MSQATKNKGKKLYYNANRLVVKDSKGSVLGNFFLKPANLPEILKLRMKIAALNKKSATISKDATVHTEKTTTALCIVRHKGEYHIAAIPSDLHFTGISCRHLCSNCANCYANATNGHGCPKIQDRYFEAVPHNYSLKSAIVSSSRIEKYSFILEGVETFGCQGYDGYKSSDVFLVFECDAFSPDCRQPKKMNSDTTNQLYSTYLNLQNEPEVPSPSIKRKKKILFPYNNHPYQ